MAARCDSLVADENIDVVPVSEVVGNRAKSRLVCYTEILQRLVRENDAPSERIVGAVPLQHRYVVRRIGLLEEQRRVQPCRATADDDDFHPGKISWIIERRCRRSGMTQRGTILYVPPLVMRV